MLNWRLLIFWKNKLKGQGGIRLTKAEVIKSWKPELKALGFVYEKSAFYLATMRNEGLQPVLSIQKNLHADTYKINVSIILRSPFGEGTEEQFLLGNLQRGGIYLHVTKASWWPVQELPEALQVLKKYLIPWFQEWGEPGHLVEILETAIREEKDIIDVIEPLSEEATKVPWRHDQRTKREIPPIYFYYTAILHYLNNDISRSIARTNDWFKSLGPSEETSKAKAQTQLRRLETIS